MKRILLALLLLSGVAYGQSNNTTNTNFTNGLASSKFFNIPRGTTPPTTGILAGSLFYHTTLGLQYYNGTIWVTVGTSGGDVTSFNGRSGVVVPLVGDYPFFPLYNGTGATGTWGIGITGNAGTVTNGVYTNGTYNNPSWLNQLAWSKITSTPTTLAGYGITDAVPNSRSITINGNTQFLSANRTWNVGTVTSVDAVGGTGISVAGVPITSSGTLTITNTAPDQTVVLTDGTGIDVTGTYPNFTITNTSPSSGGTITSITPGYGLTPQTAITSTGTFNVDSSEVQTVDNFFPKGDTRWAKIVDVDDDVLRLQDSINNRMKLDFSNRSTTLPQSGVDRIYSANQSLFIGDSTGLSISTGYDNTATGWKSLSKNSTGFRNTAYGYGTLRNNTSNYNSAFGYAAMEHNTTGDANTGIGVNALAWNTTGINNTGVGHDALEYNTIGGNNTALGYRALVTNTVGLNNTSVGSHSMYKNIDGGDNVAMGQYALYENLSGASNVAIGSLPLYNNVSGNYNIALGFETLLNNTDGFNTGIGYRTMYSNTTGDSNLGIGASSMYSNTSGDGNIGIGSSSLYTNTTGSNNLAIGNSAGRYETSSNAFYLDNQDRFNTAGDKSGALLYGTFNPTPSSQTLQANAAFFAISLARIGGTSSQFLKADGSVDANTYATTSTVWTTTGNQTGLSGTKTGTYNTNTSGTAVYSGITNNGDLAQKSGSKVILWNADNSNISSIESGSATSTGTIQFNTGGVTNAGKFNNDGTLTASLNTSTVAVTQSANDNSTKVATTAYADGAGNIVNLTTSALSNATLSSTYPSVAIGYRVICPDITGAPAIYTKAKESGATDVWLTTATILTP